jgi:micrococcal nuclease
VEEPSYTSRRSLLNLIVGGTIGLGLGSGLGRRRRARAEAIAAPDGLSPPESAAVADIRDGNTVELVGGRILRLAGIEVPSRNLAPGDAAMMRLAEGATTALRTLIGTQPIRLRFDTAKTDRYGRQVAQVFNAEGLWLQSALIADGQARVHGDGRNRLGLRGLLALEAGARNAGRGIWRHPVFALRAADDPKLGRFAGSFQIVEGRVFAVATLNGTGFINFGADRHADLTLVLKNPAMDLGGPAVDDLSWLTSRPIRCRGWLDLYDGPRIDVSYPEQIEALET